MSVTFGWPYLWDKELDREGPRLAQRYVGRAGGRTYVGNVHIAGERVELADVTRCSCGRLKTSCSSCSEYFCNAPGHAAHECTSREGEGAT